MVDRQHRIQTSIRIARAPRRMSATATATIRVAATTQLAASTGSEPAWKRMCAMAYERCWNRLPTMVGCCN